MLTPSDVHLGNVMMTPQGMVVIDWSKPRPDILRPMRCDPKY